MSDPSFDHWKLVIHRLLSMASSAIDEAAFLTTALPEIGTAVGSSTLTLVHVVAGHWTIVFATDDNGRTDNGAATDNLPLELLAAVADSEAAHSRNGWTAVPLASTNRDESRSTPSILLASESAERSLDQPLLHELALVLGPALELVRQRAQATRQARRADLQLELADREFNVSELLARAEQFVSASEVYVFTWQPDHQSWRSVTADVAQQKQLPADLAWSDTGSAGPQRYAAPHQVCQTLATALQHPVESAIILTFGEPHNGGKPARDSASRDLLIATNKQVAAAQFTDDDAADLAVLARRLPHQLRAYHRTASTGTELIGESKSLEKVRDRIRRVAPTDLPVLIMGENGTGKEVASRLVHELSPREDQPFIAVNCGALTETLLENELFGHERGAFTDADQSRSGKFEAADGGTLFLDEIGELSSRGQVKLLRVLEDKIVVRVGGSRPIACDTRVLAATNRDLAAMVREGKFREDLFFRLNVVTLELPPLRDRPHDIGLLADHFLAHFADQAGCPSARLNAAAHQRLRAHTWPGNVRELRNLMERVAFLTSDDDIGPAALGLPDTPIGSTTQNLTDATREFQIAHIKAQIAITDGNMTEAASRLGLHRSNLYRKMKQLGMQADDEQST